MTHDSLQVWSNLGFDAHKWSTSDLLVIYTWSSSATDCHMLPLAGLNVSELYRLKSYKTYGISGWIGFGWMDGLKSPNAPLL